MKRRLLIVLAVIVIALLGSLAFSFKSEFEEVLHRKSVRDLNVILIVIDALRADHLSSYGYTRPTSPQIDSFASQGTLFVNAFAPLPMTQPSFATMFTSLYPGSHEIRFAKALAPHATTLAELLRDSGWQTAAVVGAGNLDSVFGLNQGFDFYEDSLGPKINPEIKELGTIKKWERKAEEVNRLVFDWLDNKRKPGKFFLLVHYYDPHRPYHPPSPFDSMYPKGDNEKEEWRSLYDGEVSYVDHQFGLLMKKLQSLKLLQNTLVILTSDHGEGLGDHDWRGHNIKIYEEGVRVPLVLVGPDIPVLIQRSGMVEHIDIAPTILDSLNLSRPAWYQGQSLLPLKEERTYREFVLLEKAEWNLFPETQWAVRSADAKFIWSSDGRHEYYDLVKDPHEINNRFKPENREMLHLFQQGFQLRSGLPRYGLAVTPKREKDGNDPEEALKALGYIQ